MTLTTKPLRVLSLGAGVQSSTLALMIAHGEVEPVDCAIFADTQWEPRAIYEWLDWLESRLSFPVYRVTQGNLRDGVLESKNTTGGRFASVPWFIMSPDGERGMGRRQCTSEYKLKPLTRKKRELCGLSPGQRAKLQPGEYICETLIGISVDEVMRVKPSTERWNRNCWPLVDLRMSRDDCLAWMDRHGYPRPAKSSCIGCPYHGHAQWAAIMADPVMRADVIEIDEAIRKPVREMVGRQYMHASMQPMAQIDFSTAEDRGQADMFNNECEGMCGV